MQERRYYTRYALDVMNIHGEIPFATNVKILNISLSGSLLETDKRPDIGNIYILKLESEEKVLTLRGTVIRSTLNKSNKDSKGNVIPTYTAAMHFTNLYTDKIVEIAKFINDHVLDNHNQEIRLTDMHEKNGVRLYVRFLMEDLQKVSLHMRKMNYKLTNISLGGIRIESEHEMEIDEILLMEISLPEKKIVSFLGRIVSCTLNDDIETGMYEVGVEFIDISAQDKQALHEFIVSIKNRDTVQTT